MTDVKHLEAEIVSGNPVEVPERLSKWLSKEIRLLIGGKRKVGAKEKTFPTWNPATGVKLADVCLAEREDVEEAISLGRAAFDRGDWSQMPLAERAKVVRRLGDLILEHRPWLAILESLDTGKPIRESYEGDIARAATNFHFFAEFAVGEDRPVRYENGADVHVAMREPLGVVGLITPWNLPLYLETWKLAPALLMGNSCVLKPSELTPLTAAYFGELATEAGLPPGVLSVIQGFGENAAGEFLCSSPGVSAISFTGETSTGRAIMKTAAVGPTRVSFELGGKGASLVFADSDIDNAVSEAARAAFRNQGEICLACPRLFVEKSIYGRFLEAFVERAKRLRVGNPLSYHTEMGALISEDHWKKVNGYVQSAKSPARVVCGGSRPDTLPKGNFLSPTVIVDVPLDHPLSKEEVFGPVVTVYPFSTEDEVVQAANATPYGLSASVYTKDLAKAERVAKRLRDGMVWINCWFARDLRVPFGGQKRSGVGREGGKHSLDFFSEWKSVCYRGGAP